MLKIDHNVKIPAQTRKGKFAETIAKMANGDSILFPTRSKAAGFTQSLRRAGFKAETRAVDGKVRVWKLAKPGKVKK